MYTKDYQHYFLFSSIFPLRSTPDYFLFDKKIRGENYFKIVRIEQQKMIRGSLVFVVLFDQ